MDYSITGDSHGPLMVGILSGFPAGFKPSAEAINNDLFLRASSYGRGKRMQIEKDFVKIVSGVYEGQTTGAPLTFILENKAFNTEKSKRFVPRPGHGDYSAYLKYKVKDFNVYAERNSARWTVVLTAIGSLCKQALNFLGIDILGYTTRIGNAVFDEDKNDIEDLREKRNNSLVLCPDFKTSESMIEEIDNAIRFHDTVGGKVRILSSNLPGGLGDYASLENKIDSRLASILMTIPSVKGVFIGKEIYKGSDYVDSFFVESYTIKRKSNNCGGVEAGFTNGSPLRIDLFVKPIPTLKRYVQSVNIESLEHSDSPYIRSDNTSVPSVAIIAEAAVSFVILDAVLKTYGCGNVNDVKKRMQYEFKI